ncbi:MAG: indolepyruvate oxidoreductase subunit beta [Pseudomonadota bacterium]
MTATRIHITGVGGQGTILATSIIGYAALLAGINVNVSEVHGMARRGGVVESAVTMGDVNSPIISDGEADILLGFEPSETLRAAPKCSSKTVIISNSHPLAPFTVAIGKGVYPDVSAAFEKIRPRVKKLVFLDADELAHQAGSVLALNMVMLGVMAKNAELPISVENLKDAIKENTKPKFLEMNLKAFDLGRQTC